MRSRTLVAAALFVTALAPTVPARAEPTAPVRPGLLLTVSGSDNTWTRGVRLHCTPKPAGRHPRAAEACAALDRARGNLDRLPEQPTPCSLEYNPVTASASGTHRGRPVSWHHTYANACVLQAHTGPVFDF